VVFLNGGRGAALPFLKPQYRVGHNSKLLSVSPKPGKRRQLFSHTARQAENAPAPPAPRGRLRERVFPPVKKVRPRQGGPDFLPCVWLAV